MSDIYDRDWEDVTVRTIYIDGNKVRTRDLRFKRTELEREEKDMLHMDALDAPEDEQAQALVDAENYGLSHAVFKARIIRLAQEAFRTPIYLPPEEESNVIRIIAPVNIREVQITVHNMGSIIIA